MMTMMMLMISMNAVKTFLEVYVVGVRGAFHSM